MVWIANPDQLVELGIYLDISFTLVVNTRVKTLKNYSRFYNESKNYSHSTVRSDCRLWTVW